MLPVYMNTVECRDKFGRVWVEGWNHVSGSLADAFLVLWQHRCRCRRFKVEHNLYQPQPRTTTLNRVSLEAPTKRSRIRSIDHSHATITASTALSMFWTYWTNVMVAVYRLESLQTAGPTNQSRPVRFPNPRTEHQPSGLGAERATPVHPRRYRRSGTFGAIPPPTNGSPGCPHVHVPG